MYDMIWYMIWHMYHIYHISYHIISYHISHHIIPSTCITHDDKSKENIKWNNNFITRLIRVHGRTYACIIITSQRRTYQENINIYSWSILFFFFHGSTATCGPRLPRLWGFENTLRHTTLGRTPLDEWSARHRDLYLTTHNTYRRQTSMSPVGFEPAISASERTWTHALDWEAIGIGPCLSYDCLNF